MKKKQTKLKDLINESVLGVLPSEQMFKYNKATGKYEAPGSHSTNEEIEDQLDTVNEEYIETIDGKGEVLKGLIKIIAAWNDWRLGPLTAISDFKPAKKELIRYITKYLEKNI